MRKIFNGIEYDIPDDVHKEFLKWVDEVWTPSMNQGFVSDNGVKKIPTNVKALSFSLMLREKYEKEWKNYVVKDDLVDGKTI